jgi:hypothetical protein
VRGENKYLVEPVCIPTAFKLSADLAAAEAAPSPPRLTLHLHTVSSPLLTDSLNQRLAVLSLTRLPTDEGFWAPSEKTAGPPALTVTYRSFSTESCVSFSNASCSMTSCHAQRF